MDVRTVLAALMVAALGVAAADPAVAAMHHDSVLPQSDELPAHRKSDMLQPAQAFELTEVRAENESESKSDSKVEGEVMGSFWLIISFLIAVTVAFEVFKHSIEHYVRHTNAEEIVQAVWGELTVLGFLAIVCFTITKAGTGNLSLELYGEGSTEEEKKENKEKFGENLEEVHMIIFIIMIVFLCQALATIGYLNWKRRVIDF